MIVSLRSLGRALLPGLFLLFTSAFATDPVSALPALPSPQGLLAPGPKTDGPYVPLPLIPGGVVVPLYPPDSPYLNADKIREPEEYHRYEPSRLGYIVHIHNPSIEFHPSKGGINTGATIILAAGGGHNTLGVGGESIDEVYFFALQGINTVILRNRLRSDGYDPKVDGVNDALQAIKLVRAYAKEWHLDPDKIGIMGFSAGAELVAGASLYWEDFDRTNDRPENPLAKISSRPDFAALIYPGPSPFSQGASPAIPRRAPPAFFACTGLGDRIHALWATDYFTALLNDGVPNVELHIYARGRHPGDKSGPDEPPPSGGISNYGGAAFGTWSARFLDWLRDLGFLNAPGVETRAANDVAASLDRQPYKPKAPPPTAPSPAKTTP
ncbi:MAG TPA: alpha/beta hydrolase [Lacunisphaera sp.]